MFKSLQNFWHRVTDITSFETRLGSYLGHTLNFCPNLMQYRFRNMYHNESLTRSSTVNMSTNLGGSKAKRIYISSGSKIVKRLQKIVKRLKSRRYDPAIIEKTIGLVLDPFTAVHRSFLKRCTLTNKAIGSIWRDLLKPSKRRQGPDPRPLLIVSQPLDLSSRTDCA